MGFAFTLNTRILEPPTPQLHRQREEVLVRCLKSPLFPSVHGGQERAPGAGLTGCRPVSSEALRGTVADCLLQAQSPPSRLLIALFMA